MGASAGLLNLYRQVEAGEIELARAPEPEPDVPGLGIFFGSQVGWSPERESGPVDRRMIHPITGERIVVAICRECGSGLGSDPLGEEMVCAGCLRSAQDGRIAEILAKHPAPRPD